MGRRDYGPRVPKPYDFVDIEPLGPDDRQHPAGHERYHPGTVSGRLEATLIVATPLHVSSGRVKMRKGKQPPLVREMTRVNGQLCVPASTLKGVVRSVVEAITRSCLRITDAHMRRGKWKRYDVRYPEGTRGCSDPKRLCIACRMFGALGFEGHIRFDDAVLRAGSLAIASMPALWEPAKKGAGPYLKGRYPTGRKFYKHGQSITHADTPVEVIVPESQLLFSVQFDSLTPGEVGVLLTALGLGEPQLVLKLGGGKPVCYGSAIVRQDDLKVWNDAQDLYADYDVKRIVRSTDEYLEEASNLLLSDQLQQLAEIWAYDMGRRCPEGNY
ncbi:MAG TPA: RAMP superfamily CRISPR-associated protein [Anaerolineae bacterium]|nr:RAMP superfamily CRISPR-associated protein [Anaerolineae bacterium]